MRNASVNILLISSLLLSSKAVISQVYTYVDENGITVLTSKKPDPTRYSFKNHGCFGTCRTGVTWTSTPLKPKLYADHINEAANTFGVDKALIRAIMHAESWFEREALSKSGAQGLMQLMPATQARFDVKDPHDPKQNINAGVEYLAWLMKEFKQDKNLVIAAYNAGENAVKRHNGVPPFSETKEYLRRVNILYKRYSNEP